MEDGYTSLFRKYHTFSEQVEKTTMNQTIFLTEHITYSLWTAIGISVIAILSHHLRWDKRNGWGKYARFFELILIFIATIFTTIALSIQSWAWLIVITPTICTVYGKVRMVLRARKFGDGVFRLNDEEVSPSRAFIVPYTGLLCVAFFGILIEPTDRTVIFDTGMVVLSMSTAWGLIYSSFKEKLPPQSLDTNSG